LKDGLKSVKHHKAGWLKEALLRNGELDGTKKALYARIWADYSAQLIHIRAQQEILGEDYNPLHVYSNRDKNGHFVSARKVKPHPRPNLCSDPNPNTHRNPNCHPKED
jgi:hypothetical protein